MILALIIVAAIAVIWLVERSAEQLRLAIAALGFIAAALLFAVADLERAILLSSIAGGRGVRDIQRQIYS